MAWISLTALALAAVCSAMAMPLTIALAKRCGWLDEPNARKVHTQPIPRVGGIAIVGSVLLAATTALVYMASTAELMPAGITSQLLGIAGAGTFIFVIGLIDDIYGLPSRFKLVGLLTATLMVCGSGATFEGLLFGGRQRVEFQWVDWAITMLWIAGIAVSINFIDGLDGLAGGLTLLASAILSVFLMLSGQFAAATLPLALSGALLGFLLFNWHPAKVFMGDSGSMTIGFLVGSATVMANPLVGTMRGVVLPAMALSVPIGDAVLTIFRRRYQQRRSIFSAEKGHIHHKLLLRGLTHPQAVIAIYAISIAVVMVGLISLQFEGLGTLGGLSLAIPLLYGGFRIAGSIRTNEMLSALRKKRHADRVSQGYRAAFEALQLEFADVKDFAGWWQWVCRVSSRLDFVTVRIPIASRDGNVRELEWKTTDDRFADCTQMTATVPIEDRRRDNGPLMASVEVPSSPYAATSLESAGERIALFSRLMQECSLRSLAQKSPQEKSKGSVAKGRSAQVGEGPFGKLRVAIVHDFLYVNGGAERVVEQLINLFPHCDVYALFDFLPEKDRYFLKGKSVRTTFLQHLPFIRTKHRAYMPLMPFAMEQFDLGQYDLVVSSSYLAAKGVLTGPDQIHICYCHTPPRYAWDLQAQYLAESGLGFGPKGIVARAALHYLRSWDISSANGVDKFIANSHFVAARIKKFYRREAEVVYPPVDVDSFAPQEERGDFYLAVSRMVPYKRTDLIVGAFSETPHRKLKVIGEGPDFERVRKLAGPNVEILGYQDKETVVWHMQRAKALIFAAEEDFGIVPVEAMACGTPVIAYGRGGVTESVQEGVHGTHFDSQTHESLTAAVDRFESECTFDDEARKHVRQHSEDFSEERFIERVEAIVADCASLKWPHRIAKSVEAKHSSTDAARDLERIEGPHALTGPNRESSTSTPSISDRVERGC